MSFFGTRKEATEKRTHSLPQFDPAYYNKQECKACPLDRLPVKSPKMEPTGSDHPVYYVLGEAPGADEDEQGKQFIGRSGQFLRAHIPDGAAKKIRWNNCVRNRPPGNREPTQVEMECCRPSIVRDIEATKPKVIIGVGGVALRWACGQNQIKKWRGSRMPLRIGSHACWFYPILHPSFVQRAKNFKDDKGLGREWEDVFKFDLQHIFEQGERLPPPEPTDVATLSDDVMIETKNVGEIEDWVFTSDDLVSIDFEMNCLRPYSAGAKILTIAITDHSGTLAFPFDHPSHVWKPRDREALFGILLWLVTQGKEIVAQNLSTELEWLVHLFGPHVVLGSRWHDTLVQSYCLDENLIANLGALTIRHFGFNLKQQTKVKRKQILQSPLDETLRYNALDAKFTRQIFIKQQKELAGLEHVYEMQVSRMPALILAQAVGLVVDFDAVEAFNTRFVANTAEIDKEIAQCDEVKYYERVVGKMFNPNSPEQVTKILQEHLKRPEGIRGKKYSTDVKVLEQINIPFTRLILKRRRVEKLRGTYVEALRKGAPQAGPKGKQKKRLVYPDGRLHTKFNLSRTVTGRLSSSDPNVQNFPRRKFKEIRAEICAPPGHLMLAADYKQIEVCLIGMASKDDALCKAIRERYDSHLDWAQRVADVDPGQLDKVEGDIKKLRDIVKNLLVFPWFYGAMAKSVAAYLDMKVSIAEGLYRDFWKMFSGVREWQKSVLREYQQYGYVTCLTGRRRHAPLSHSMVINTPIQGTASDIVVDAMQRLSHAALVQERPELQAVMNIHDDLTFYVPEERLDDTIPDIASMMVSPPFDWLHDVPITIDMSLGRNWAELKPIGVFSSDD